ncbi:hypothetical protein FA95DRAFT_1115980 [Auriscalpium vulgare]|uniref:Uncharacterized protein n=1 Tax=Auriscalpium vulgare TaxID=40419 RepID=A0ACB8RW63_9AGAM|nr:hypothetical protein FA95DRAFT_1115980 [Auriscalpium vulgare]
MWVAIRRCRRVPRVWLSGGTPPPPLHWLFLAFPSSDKILRCTRDATLALWYSQPPDSSLVNPGDFVLLSPHSSSSWTPCVFLGLPSFLHGLQRRRLLCIAVAVLTVGVNRPALYPNTGFHRIPVSPPLYSGSRALLSPVINCGALSRRHCGRCC